jgi:hypothetical protein
MAFMQAALSGYRGCVGCHSGQASVMLSDLIKPH